MSKLASEYLMTLDLGNIRYAYSLEPRNGGPLALTVTVVHTRETWVETGGVGNREVLLTRAARIALDTTGTVSAESEALAAAKAGVLAGRMEAERCRQVAEDRRQQEMAEVFNERGRAAEASGRMRTTRRNIELDLTNGSRVSVSAYTHQGLAYHKDLGAGDTGWTVTHLYTGMAVARGLLKGRARHLMARLLELGDWSGKVDAEFLAKAIPVRDRLL